MKSKFSIWLGAALSLALCIIFASVFISYSQPMDNDVYNLSLIKDVSEIESIDNSGALGWTVYTQQGEERTILTYDMSVFSGLTEPGQTVYYSRVMQEALDSPTLQIGTANRNFSVFLDGELIYTDCPEQDNRIGYLALPMREWDRKEALAISLPEDYVGKTLTIAQSTPADAETAYMASRVVPASVTLYCSYAYESELIAESFQTASLGAVCYAFGLILLLLFIRQLFLGRFDWSLLLLTLAVFLCMTVRMYDASYAMKYFGISTHVDMLMLCQKAVVTVMVAFLASKAPRLRIVCWLLTGLCVLSTVLFSLYGNTLHLNDPLFMRLIWNSYDVPGTLALLFMLVLSWFWRRESGFFRAFAPLSVVGVGLYLLVHLLLPNRSAFFTELLTSIRNLSFHNVSYHIAVTIMLAAMAITEVRAVRHEINLHTEKQLMLEMSRMSQQRYENLRKHTEEVMALRHDMIRHFSLLRQMTTEEKPAQYLDELIGVNEKIRPVLQSGNEMIDIILASRLGMASDAGLQVELVRAKAPEQLPMSDADLCSLTMNLLDNAIEAASKSGMDPALLKLDLHVKNNFFVFICENSTSVSSFPAEKEETVPKHGLGLKIVHQIAERHDALLQTEFSQDLCKVSLAIPLAHPSK